MRASRWRSCCARGGGAASKLLAFLEAAFRDLRQASYVNIQLISAVLDIFFLLPAKMTVFF
jgi:hypothetical protein